MTQTLIITPEDWKAWKQDTVTQLFYEAVKERIEDAKETLANTAGQDMIMDNFYRGFIYAYREMLEFKVEEQEGELLQ